MISIITPTLRRDLKIVRRCIASLRGQTYSDWEQVICSDGVYEPDVEALVREQSDSRISYRWFSQPLGHYGAGVRQAVMKFTKGEYLAFIDDDNVVFPNYLERMLEALEATPDASFAICRVLHCGPLPAHLGSPPQVVTGVPPVLQNIDTLQVVVRREAMLEADWQLQGYLSDGYTYQVLGQRYQWVEVPEILGVHL